MVTSNGWNLRSALSAVLAATIVAVNGLALDRGHISAAPDGIVEVGDLMAVDALPGVATLAEVVVTVPRYAMVTDEPRA